MLRSKTIQMKTSTSLLSSETLLRSLTSAKLFAIMHYIQIDFIQRGVESNIPHPALFLR